MNTMTKIKRAVVGGYAKADVTGTGDWLVGKIVETDKNMIWFDPADGSDTVRVGRAHAYKATKAEYDNAAKGIEPKEEEPVIEPKGLTDSEEVSLEDALAESGEPKEEQPELLPEPTDPVDHAIWKRTNGQYIHCPKCNIHLENGLWTYEEALDEHRDQRTESFKGEEMLKHDFWCMGCGEEFGKFRGLPADTKLKPKLDKYKVGLSRTASGRQTVDIDDPVAALLRGMEIEDVYSTVSQVLSDWGVETFGRGAKKSGILIRDLTARYGHLNVGMQRMNLGNLLRGQMNSLGLTEKDLPKRFATQ